MLRGWVGGAGGLIRDLSAISVFVSHVRHDLDASVGQGHAVLARGDLALALLQVAVGRARVVVTHAVREVVAHVLLRGEGRARVS